jgi:hypothetical protein
MSWRIRIFLQDWNVFLLIMAAGLLTGFLTWMASQPAPVCHRDCGFGAYYKGAQETQTGP